MTVKEASQLYGVTVPAINQKLKRAGYDINSIRKKDEKTGFFVFTEEGEAILDKLFSRKHTETGEPEGSQTEREELANRIEEQEQTIRDLRKEKDSLLETIASLKHELSEAKTEKERIMTMLETEQDNHRKLLLALPSPEDQTKRKGFFSLFRK